MFLIGAGFGCMPPLAATALQNNVSIHTFGSAVATMQFSRNLFATMLVAVFGVLILSGVSRPGVGAASQYSVDGFVHVFLAVAVELRGLAHRRTPAERKAARNPAQLEHDPGSRPGVLRYPAPSRKRRDGATDQSAPRAPAGRDRHGLEPHLAVCRIGLCPWRRARAGAEPGSGDEISRSSGQGRGRLHGRRRHRRRGARDRAEAYRRRSARASWSRTGPAPAA